MRGGANIRRGPVPQRGNAAPPRPRASGGDDEYSYSGSYSYSYSAPKPQQTTPAVRKGPQPPVRPTPSPAMGQRGRRPMQSNTPTTPIQRPAPPVNKPVDKSEDEGSGYYSDYDYSDQAPNNAQKANPNVTPQPVNARNNSQIAQTPNQQPSLPANQPQVLLVNQPQTIPMNQPQVIVVNQPQVVPANQPQTITINQPQTIPVNQPQTIPVNQPQTIPLNQPQTIPVNQLQTIPVNQPQTVPANQQINRSSLPISANGLQSYQISYESAMSIWKRPVNMTQNDIIKFSCKPSHENKRKIHQIYSYSSVIEANDTLKRPQKQDVEGVIIRHESGSRFTLVGKPSDGSPQLAGIAFMDIPELKDVRYFKLALPTGPNPYKADSKEKDLSRIAMNGTPVEGVRILESEKPYKKNGKWKLHMGKYQVKRSLKNFVIKDKEKNEDSDDSISFIIFKALDGICKIKTKDPISPLVAFSIGVAILTSWK